MTWILTVLSVFAPMAWVIMKPDKELPWYLRILRWGGATLALAYGALLVAEKFKEVFL